MKKLIIFLTLLTSLASISVALARDANRDALQRMWNEQQMQQRQWEAVVTARTSAERAEAYKIYIYNLPELWEPAGN